MHDGIQDLFLPWCAWPKPIPLIRVWAVFSLRSLLKVSFFLSMRAFRATLLNVQGVGGSIQALDQVFRNRIHIPYLVRSPHEAQISVKPGG